MAMQLGRRWMKYSVVGRRMVLVLCFSCIYSTVTLLKFSITTGKYSWGTRWAEWSDLMAAGIQENQNIYHNSSLIRGNGPSTYITLPPPNASKSPISFDACCGIGHRLSRDIPALVYAISQSRTIHPVWTDVNFFTLFNETTYIKNGERADEMLWNGYPKDWYNFSSLASHHIVKLDSSDAYNAYNDGALDDHLSSMRLFEMPLGHSIVKSLSDNLSPLVLSYLGPLRSQYVPENVGLHLCAHIREGNNETGDWEGKTWRHINLFSILNETLESMKTFTQKTSSSSRNANKQQVSVFVASDNTKARTWFEDNVPNKDWHVVKPGKEMSRPENGVWFGEHGSKTSSNLTQNDLNEAMAEAVADVFALGECDALYIPSYSSFSVTGIMLTRAERRKIFFLGKDGFVEYPGDSPIYSY